MSDRKPSLIDLLGQYMRDAAPGGVLNQEIASPVRLIDLIRQSGGRAENNVAPSEGLLSYTGSSHPITGRPVMRAPDGRRMTEYAMTISHPKINQGMFTNIPSIWNGQIIDDEDVLVEMALKSGRRFPAYKTVDEAVSAAKARSKNLGLLMPE